MRVGLLSLGADSRNRLGLGLTDYKTIVLTGGVLGRHKDELRRDHLEQRFDQLGNEGWELTWVPMEQSLHREKDGHVVIFKRPLPD